MATSIERGAGEAAFAARDLVDQDQARNATSLVALCSGALATSSATRTEATWPCPRVQAFRRPYQSSCGRRRSCRTAAARPRHRPPRASLPCSRPCAWPGEDIAHGTAVQKAVARHSQERPADDPRTTTRHDSDLARHAPLSCGTMTRPPSPRRCSPGCARQRPVEHLVDVGVRVVEDLFHVECSLCKEMTRSRTPAGACGRRRCPDGHVNRGFSRPSGDRLSWPGRPACIRLPESVRIPAGYSTVPRCPVPGRC
jgi:hypothetical protein